jgi:hypothetical protein
MHQLVFVHGVNTRENDAYEQELKNRNQLFSQVAFQGAALNIRNTYWGKFGAEFSHDLACLPSKGGPAQSFGLAGALPGAPAAETQVLSAGAAADLGATIDAIFVHMVERAEAERKPLTPDQIAMFAKAGEYAEANAKIPPLWAKDAKSDDDVTAALRDRVAPKDKEAFGLWDDLAQAAKDAADTARNAVSSGAAPIIRDYFSPLLAVFLGDVFLYLYGGGTPRKRDEIRSAIAADVNAAFRDAKNQGGKLIVIGHSLGGVILCDMLANADSGFDTGLKIDLLATVGSQPGLFQELSLFGTTVKTPDKSKLSDAMAFWWNVYDPVDLLSFRCEPIFQTVQDFAFSSVTGMIDAHTSYFKRPRFYIRLRERLRDTGIGS